jgi:6-phosphogluconate dehydrogenase
MQLGMIGLGRVGANIVRRLMRHGHSCIVFDANAEAVNALAREGATPALNLADLCRQLNPPRNVWVMLPAGAVTETTISKLAGELARNDTLIDGGNTYWGDDIRRARQLADKGLHYVDVGTSDGVFGLERGYRLEPIFQALAPGVGQAPRTAGRDGRDPRVEQGYLHAGPNGAGHFEKMVHNSIEYGLMQAYAAGFDLLKNAECADLPSNQRFQFDPADIAEVSRRGA